VYGALNSIFLYTLYPGVLFVNFFKCLRSDSCHYRQFNCSFLLTYSLTHTLNYLGKNLQVVDNFVVIMASYTITIYETACTLSFHVGEMRQNNPISPCRLINMNTVSGRARCVKRILDKVTWEAVSTVEKLAKIGEKADADAALSYNLPDAGSYIVSGRALNSIRSLTHAILPAKQCKERQWTNWFATAWKLSRGCDLKVC